MYANNCTHKMMFINYCIFCPTVQSRYCEESVNPNQVFQNESLMISMVMLFLLFLFHHQFVMGSRIITFECPDGLASNFHQLSIIIVPRGVLFFSIVWCMYILPSINNMSQRCMVFDNCLWSASASTDVFLSIYNAFNAL